MTVMLRDSQRVAGVFYEATGRAAWGAGDRKEPYLGRCRHLKDPRPPMSFHRESRENSGLMGYRGSFTVVVAEASSR